jgi:hypothetical protein
MHDSLIACFDPSIGETMNTRRRPIVNYRFMLIPAIIVGIVSVGLSCYQILGS